VSANIQQDDPCQDDSEPIRIQDHGERLDHKDKPDQNQGKRNIDQGWTEFLAFRLHD
jgi:hypothetical protein